MMKSSKLCFVTLKIVVFETSAVNFVSKCLFVIFFFRITLCL